MPTGNAPADDDASQMTSRLAAIVEFSTDAIFSLAMDGIITTWNPAAADMYGYTAAEITGRSVTKLVPPGRAREPASVLDQIRRKQRVQHFETQHVRKDGALIDVSVSVSPILDASETVTGAAAVARDITDRNRAAAQIRVYQDQIHRAERLETVGQLAGNIAHDFSNMIGAIIGFAGLITRETADRGAVAQDARQILVTAQRAARLTKELLVISRRLPNEPQTVNTSTLIAGLRDLLDASTGPQVTLRLDLGADTPDTYADPGRIEQALLNLAINARDAMPDGGTLTIATTRTHLSDRAARQLGRGIEPGDYAELTVTDTGTGMSPEVAARAFEPFFTTKERAHGTGLGLSTVREVIAQAGGTIAVKSEPGAGSSFHIFLPAATAAVSRMLVVPAPAPPADDIAARRTILVADDEPAVLQATARILRQGGYATLEAPSGYEALTLLIANQVHLLLTDVVMPGMSGIVLADTAENLRPGLPVLHMSGYTPASPADEKRLFIRKPFTADTLLSKIRETLDARPARRS